jgi:hypothetical protein
MDAVTRAIKLNIKYHFDRFMEDCQKCPFYEECVKYCKDIYLCEIITEKLKNRN